MMLYRNQKITFKGRDGEARAREFNQRDLNGAGEVDGNVIIIKRPVNIGATMLRFSSLTQAREAFGIIGSNDGDKPPLGEPSIAMSPI